jgi:carbon starvation protein
MVTALVVIAVVLLAAGYLVYGRRLERLLGVEPSRPTPAHTMTDNLDYVPTKPAVLFGHHFSSIAGAGPIVGPVIATAAFGWLPAIVWVVLGSILIGGVQDFSSLVASIRHRARSVADIARQNISPLAHRLFLVFVWFALVYVIVVFVDLTSETFVQDPGVASSSAMYIALAVVFGLLIYRAGLRVGPASFVFVPLVFIGIWLGQKLPLVLPLADGGQGWDILLLGYCLLASVLPVWLLLQPRDYLSSFLLYACLAGAAVGVLAGGGALPPGVEPVPALITLHDPSLGWLFPAMFVVIACGACSGFHAIVASGTTAKQLDNEGQARPVAYGGMLLEGVLATIAIGTVLLLGLAGVKGQAPTFVFAKGIGHLLGAVGISPSLGAHFGALAVSTFLLTTLDTCTRLARYVLEEMLGLPRGKVAISIAATLATLALPLALTQMTLHLPDGTPAPAWRVIWPVFGATNQLLGALAMLVVTAWLRNQGRRHAFVAVPMLFMFGVTLVALAQLVWRYTPATFVGFIAALLFVLAWVLLAEAFRRVFAKPPGQAVVSEALTPSA